MNGEKWFKIMVLQLTGADDFALMALEHTMRKSVVGVRHIKERTKA